MFAGFKGGEAHLLGIFWEDDGFFYIFQGDQAARSGKVVESRVASTAVTLLEEEEGGESKITACTSFSGVHWKIPL